MNEPTHELEAYFAGDCTDEQLRAVEAWINADPANAQAFMQQAHFRELLGERMREPRIEGRAVLTELAQLEERAEVIRLAPESAAQSESGQVDDAGSLSAHDIVAAGGYLLGKSLTSRPALYAYAAAILLAAALFLIPWASTPTPTVATLTAQHNAVWASQPGGDVRPGTTLTVGQRLNLTAGLAEITTARGAIAIIEAPATIEFIDNDNALQLHTGKLVGICQTPSSKGFLVRTAALDVTDLGTRFGVDSNSRATEVHVFEGEVAAHRPGAAPDTQPMRLVAKQSARSSVDTDTIARIDHDADRFAALLPDTFELTGTGQGVAPRQKDPNWQIVAIDGKTLPSPRAVIAGQHGHNVDTSKPNHAQWISMRTRGMRFENGQASFIFRTTLDLPAAVQPGRHRLAIRYMADNELRSIRVNGQTLDTNIPQPRSIREFSPPIGFQITPKLQAGANVIEFEVIDHAFSGTSGAFVGLYIDWELLAVAGSQDP